MRLAAAFLVMLLLAACSPIAQPCAQAPSGDVVYVVGQGWHTDIGIPVSELDEHLAYFRDEFPGAKTIMFGYGKRTFVTAPPETISEYILGPVPGPAVIHAVGLRVTPAEAYPAESTTVLALAPGGAHALSEAIWNDLVKDAKGQPKFVAHSTNPDGSFYDAISEYNLLHTCNSWTADMLHSAGIALDTDGITFSYQTIDRVNDAVAAQCKLSR